MPLKKCSESGKSGWKWGDKGKCYIGKDGKKKALKQGVAIEGPEKFQQMASSLEDPLTADELETIVSSMYDSGASTPEIISSYISLKNK